MDIKQPFIVLLIGISQSLGWSAQPIRAQESPRLVDLTYTFNDSTIFWPTAEPFKLHRESEGMIDKRYFYSAHRISLAEHGGTHIDSPHHFWKTGKTVY